MFFSKILDPRFCFLNYKNLVLVFFFLYFILFIKNIFVIEGAICQFFQSLVRILSQLKKF